MSQNQPHVDRSDRGIQRRPKGGVAVPRCRLDALEPRMLLSGVAFNATQSILTGPKPMSAAVADFDGDGTPDVVVASSEPGQGVSLSLNNGSGALGPQKLVRAFDAYAVASGDFNGDGRPDLAVGNIDGFGVINVLLNTGGGTFGPAVPRSLNNAPAAIASADFDGDGRMDLAVATKGGIGLNVLRGNGDGTFAAPALYGVSGATAVVAADFTGDGRPELAVAAGSANLVTVLRNNGSGGFPSHVDYPVGSSPKGLAAADFNNDGRIDLASANGNGNSVSVLRNTGDGAFAPKVDYGLGFTTFPVSITSADLTGDGRPDLATANSVGVQGNPVTVLKNNGDGTFTPYANYPDGGPLRVFVTNADFDLDGRADLALVSQQVSSAATNVGSLNLLHNRGDALIFGSVSSNTGYADDMVAADFNGDGRPDVAVADGPATMGVMLNPQGSDALAARVDYTVGDGTTKAHAITAADFTGDGRPDVAVASYGGGNRGVVSVLRNNGNGTFAAKVDYVTSGTYDIAAADFNGDGRADLVTANWSGSNTVSVLLNNGSGTFGAKVDYPTGRSPTRLATGDFDGDGRVDIAVTAGGDGTVNILRNLGGGTFAGHVDYPSASGAIVAADLTGDGRPDLAVTSYSTDAVSILRNNGNGTFAARVDYPSSGDGPVELAAGDFDGDGRLDLAVSHEIGRMVGLLVNRGDGSFTAGPVYVPGGSNIYGPIVGADFTGDGAADLAVGTFSAFVFVLPNISDVAPHVVPNSLTSTMTAIRVTFSENVAASLAAGDLVVTPAGGGAGILPTSVTYDAATNTARFLFAGPLPDGNYRARIAAADVRDTSNKPLAADYAADFFVLGGDTNHDRLVNFADLLTLARNYNGTGKTYEEGDFNGDGLVNFADLLTLARNYNKTLAVPPPPAPAPVMMAAAPATALLTADAGAPAGKRKAVFSTSPVAAAKPAASKAKGARPPSRGR